MRPSRQSLLISNTLWNAVGRAATVAVGLFLTPYILGRVGQERFGLWALANLLIGYLSLADLGIQSSLVRQIAHAEPEQNPTKLSQIVSTSFFFYLGAFLLFGPFSIGLGPWLVQVLRRVNISALPDSMVEEGIFVVTFVSATLFLSIAVAVFTSILPGLQRMDRANQLVIVTSVANLVAAVFVLEKGWGVPGLVAGILGVKVISSVFHYYVARRLCPYLRLSMRHVRWSVWKELFSFGWRIQVARVLELLTFGFDRLFLSLFGGVAALGRYQPAVQVATHARILPHLLVSAALPYASELSARGDRKTLIALYIEGTLFLSFASYAILGFIALSAPLLTSAWLGPGFADVALWIRIFCVGYLVTAPLSLGGLLSQAIGRPGLQARSALLGTVLTLVLSPAGLWIGGMTGLATGATLAVVCSGIWFFWAINAALDVSIREVLRRCFAPPVLYLLVPALILALLSHPFAGAEGSRAKALLAVMLVGVLFTAPCLLGMKRLDLLGIRRRLAGASAAALRVRALR